MYIEEKFELEVLPYSITPCAILVLIPCQYRLMPVRRSSQRDGAPRPQRCLGCAPLSHRAPHKFVWRRTFSTARTFRLSVICLFVLGASYSHVCHHTLFSSGAAAHTQGPQDGRCGHGIGRRRWGWHA